jgi:hypothetical protein
MQQLPRLFNHLVGELLQLQRHFDAERLGGLEVEGEDELDGPLYRQVAGLGSLQNLVHIGCGASVQVGIAWSVEHQAANLNQLTISIDPWQALLYRKVYDALAVMQGIVSKRLGSPYVSGRSRHWVKSKNPQHPAVKREAEEEWS